MLGEQKFASNTEVQSVVRQSLAQQPASFFASDIQKLVERWDKCLNKLDVMLKNTALTSTLKMTLICRLDL